MKLVFTHANSMMVQYAAQMMIQASIQHELRNEFVTSVMGTGAPCDAWPELWVAEEDEVRALEVLQSLSEEVEGEIWCCDLCGEMNEPNFDVCWKCHSGDLDERP